MPIFSPSNALQAHQAIASGAWSGQMDEKLATGLEWWIGNYAGGWASASACGALTRKYHALLAVAHPCCEQRRILLGKFEEIAIANEKEYMLSTNYYPGTIYPQGFKLIERFLFDGAVARWTFGFEGRRLAKEVWCDRAMPATYIRYTLLEGDPIGVCSIPLVSGRLAHGIGLPDFMRRRPGGLAKEREVLYLAPFSWGIKASAGIFRPKPDFYYNMRYPREEERLEEAQEDWACPGRFEFALKEGQQVTLKAWAKTMQTNMQDEEWKKEQGRASEKLKPRLNLPMKMNMPTKWGNSIEKESFAGMEVSFGNLLSLDGRQLDFASDPEEASRRISRIIEDFRAYNGWGEIPVLENLVRASDNFIIKDGGHFNIIAGYPYFGVWARDALISVPGICACTGRHALGRDILLNWIGRLKGGLLPSHYDEEGRPIFESADGTLWLFWALSMLESEGGMTLEFLRLCWPSLALAIEQWLEGTKFSYIESDGLVSLKQERLTWMDAAQEKDGKLEPITPRAGKRVEINALWIHALACASRWAASMGDEHRAQKFDEAASMAREGFRKFYHDFGHYLHDGLDPNDDSIRPNQLWAIALPSVGISPIAARRTLGTLIKTLWAQGIGVRSLSQNDASYHARFYGGQKERDEAYHQGAVWPWLSGAWAESWLRYYPKRSEELKRQLEEVAAARLPGTMLGVCEVRDPTSGADGGCPMQAWSVAELIRGLVLVERTRRWSGGFAILSPSLEEITSPLKRKK